MAADAPQRSDAQPGRETDRLEALEWRRYAVWGVPLVMATWLIVIVGWAHNASVVSAATFGAVLAAAGLGARAAVATVRFRRRWAPDIGTEAPPSWITLTLVGAAIAATVGWSNVVAGAGTHGVSTWPMMVSAAFTALAGLAAWRHVAGARSLAAELHRSSE